MGKRAQRHPLEDNPFLQGFSEWMDSPDGELSAEAADAVWELLAGADVDARHRKIRWDNKEALDIEPSVKRIHGVHPHLSLELIETHVLSWLECGFVPQDYSQQQLDQLDALIERWIEDYQRKRRRR
jgi:hypothetical protein